MILRFWEFLAGLRYHRQPLKEDSTGLANGLRASFEETRGLAVACERCKDTGSVFHYVMKLPNGKRRRGHWHVNCFHKDYLDAQKAASQ